MEKFKDITVEISNICNAKCKYCTTGINNVQQGIPKWDGMKKETFQQGIDYLINNDIVEEKANFMLYNWGEPFLNPDLLDILGIIVSRDMCYTLTTNASKYLEIPYEYMKNMNGLLISLSGFSADTYIHGFDIDVIKNNIRMFAEHFKKFGMEKLIKLNFHVYQSNFREYHQVKKFCDDLGITFFPHFAYFADSKSFNDFLKKDFSNTLVRDGQKDLFTFWYDEYTKLRPDNYDCPQNYNLVMNEKWELLLCCSKSIVLGSIFDMTLADIHNRKQNAACVECQKNHADFMLHNMPETCWHFPEIVTKREETVDSFIKVYYDCGKGYNEEDCIHLEIENPEAVNYFKVQFPVPVQSFRIDPVERMRCVLEAFQIEGLKEYREYFDETTKVYPGGILVMNSKDPGLKVETKNPVQEFIIRMKINKIVE